MEMRPVRLMAQAAPQISVQGIVKDFNVRDSGRPLRALDGIDLTVGKGEFVVLLGPSGCGKSTLLSIIAGFQHATQGEALQEGQTITGPDRRRTVVFQDYALFPWMTVQENVAFGLKAQGMGRTERHEIAQKYISMVRLTGFEQRYPHEISGGMKQRAAIARALAPNPDVLLMDEPFGALDAQTRVLLQEEVARVVHNTGKTVIFVTHSIEEGVFLGDRIVVMSARPGRIKHIYDVPLKKPRTPETRRRNEFVELVEDLWDSLKPEWQME